VGRALADSATGAGHSVTISSASPDDAEVCARQTGARSVGSNRAAVEAADVVVLAVPYQAVGGILDEVGDVLNGKIVVDVTNPVKPDLSGVAMEASSEAEAIQERVPGRGW
jgi:hypothetical protein